MSVLETVLESLQEVKSDTKVKAWVFQIDKNFYQVASYELFRAGMECGIWNSTKKGKRVDQKPIFTLKTSDYKECVSEFVGGI